MSHRHFPSSTLSFFVLVLALDFTCSALAEPPATTEQVLQNIADKNTARKDWSASFLIAIRAGPIEFHGAGRFTFQVPSLLIGHIMIAETDHRLDLRGRTKRQEFTSQFTAGSDQIIWIETERAGGKAFGKVDLAQLKDGRPLTKIMQEGPEMPAGPGTQD